MPAHLHHRPALLSAVFYSSFASFFFPLFPCPFLFLWRTTMPGKCLVATVWNRHTIHRFLRRLIATRAGIHYTSDFLSISCGASRNSRFKQCEIIFITMVLHVWRDSAGHIDNDGSTRIGAHEDVLFFLNREI